MRRAGGYAAVGFVVGIATGAIVWGTRMQRSRRDLFSMSPVKRFAALGSLRHAADPETAWLLRDYVQWEQMPSLRKRAERILRRFDRGAER